MKPLFSEPLSITGPWGSYEISTGRQVLEMLCDQLQYFLDHDESRNREFTASDLRCYRQILATGSEDLAIVFIQEKGRARDAGRPFKDNEAVIAHLKATGLWGSWS